MSMFSSRPPFNADPLPYVWPGPSPISGGETRSMFSHGDGIALHYNPRPEFARPQHNPTNPILTWARDEGIDAPLAEVTFSSGSYLVGGWIGDVQVTSSHVVHARRVLTRLASLTKEETA